VFEGQVEVMLNRKFGDGICLTWPEFLIFNTSGGYAVQFLNGHNIAATPTWPLLGTYHESVTAAYIAAQVHLGKLELVGDEYIPVANA